MSEEELRGIDNRVAVEFGWKWRNPPWYTTDPADADLVRFEIERRGWVWSIGPWEDGKYICNVSGGTYRCSKPPYGIVQGDSPHIALCLAFLAACDATKEDKVNATD